MPLGKSRSGLRDLVGGKRDGERYVNLKQDAIAERVDLLLACAHARPPPDHRGNAAFFNRVTNALS